MQKNSRLCIKIKKRVDFYAKSGIITKDNTQLWKGIGVFMKDFKISQMTIDDYEGLKALWMTIHGFGIRSIDDSREGVERFLNRNPGISVVAKNGNGEIVGGILCGHDGRRGCLYHVCVREDYRLLGIGKAMVVECMKSLKEEKINKVCLIAFTQNDVGNAFWKCIGWTKREDLNYYDFVLNEENITAFNK